MPSLSFQGETFALEDSYATMMVADFAAGSPEGGVNLIALRELLQHLIAAEDWQRFHDLSVSSRASTVDLIKALEDAMEAIIERPTVQPSDSSDGQEHTPQRSEGDFSLRVIGRLEGQGRPDLALQVKRAQEFQAQESLTA